MTVIVIDDDALARCEIRSAVTEAGFTVIAQAANGRDGAELAIHYRPDFAIIDFMMPGMDGIETTSRILASAAEVNCLILSKQTDAEVGVQALRAGARGYLAKHELDAAALAQVLNAAAEGELVCSRGFTAAMFDRLLSMPDAGVGMRPVRSELTDREWEVLDLLCQSCSTDEIAAELVISPETVRSHLKSTMRRLGVESREDAVLAAHRLRFEAAPRPQGAPR